MTPKVAMGVLGAAILGYGIYWLMNRRNNPHPPKDRQNQKEVGHREVQPINNLRSPELTQLSKSLDKEHPTQDQVIELFKIIVRESKAKGEDFINTFRVERRKLAGGQFSEYVEYIRDGLMRLKNIDGEAKQEILGELGMSSEQYGNAELRYQQAFQETESQILYGQDNYLPLEEVRRIVDFQKDYLETQGEGLLIRLNQEMKGWNSEQRELVHQIMNTLIIDEVFRKFGYQEDLTERSIIKCKHEVMDEILEIRDILTELFIKLSEEITITQESEEDVRLNTQLMRGLSGEPQFEEMMKAMHLE